MDVYESSIELHKKLKGKIEIKSKFNIKNKDDLSLAYTPGVAGVSRVIDKDKSRVNELTTKANLVAIVTDGSAVLGLGNIGPEASLPVMEGKAVLFKEFADIDAFPICLKTQNVDDIVNIVKNISPGFGGVNLEDISAPRCFEIEDRLRQELDIPVMHDDQHGTATVVLAGLINALKLRDGKNKSDLKIVLSGAGAAGFAITKILLRYGIKNIIVCDSKGIVSTDRNDLNYSKKMIAKLTNVDDFGSLDDAIEKADVFVGISAPDVLTKSMIKKMASNPIIFALANPTPEIMPNEALEAGAYIVATGRSDFPNQINNVLAFPGLFRALLGTDRQFSDDIFVLAAEAIANSVSKLSTDNIVPSVFDKGVVDNIVKVINKWYEK